MTDRQALVPRSLGAAYAELFPLVRRPSRYLGNEVNAIRKDLAKAALRVALVFPDQYEIGMANTGIQILYHILNARDDIACERAFAPDTDFAARLQERGLPLCSWENKAPLASFDLLGFSLSTEISYTSALWLLDLAGLPRRAADRGEGHPLVCAGGHAAYNAEPMADFFDFFVLGEGEDVVVEIAELLLRHDAPSRRRRGESAGLEREAFLRKLASLPGVYVPALYASTYDNRGFLEQTCPADGTACPPTVMRRIVWNLDEAAYPTRVLVPFAEAVHNRVSIEASRGCTEGCRFCQAGMILRPVRNRSVDEVQRLARESLQATGFDELAMTSLHIADYPGLRNATEILMDDFADSGVRLSFPSLRPGALDPAILHELQRSRSPSLTLAPEAASERLRLRINKPISDSELLEDARRIFATGWLALKLYFLIGIPTEEQEDLEAIIDLSRRVLAIGKRTAGGRARVTVNVSTLVPKANTPFQWCGQVSRPAIREKLAFLRARAKQARLELRWDIPERSFLEAILSRGDRRLGNVIEKAYLRGAKLDGWSEHFDLEPWFGAFADTGLDPEWYATRDIPYETALPWEHLQCGATKQFLWRELQNALKGRTSPDCRESACHACGMTCVTQKTILRAASAGRRQHRLAASLTMPELTFYRGRYRKEGWSRFLSHLELRDALVLAARRAALPLAYSQGFNPQPRIDLGLALPLGVAGIQEPIELALLAPVDPGDLESRLNEQLPEGIAVYGVARRADGRGPGLADCTRAISYVVRFPEGSASRREYFQQQVDIVLRRPELVVERTKKGASKHRDIRSFISDIRLQPGRDDPGALDLVLELTASRDGTARPGELLAALLPAAEGWASWEIRRAEVLLDETTAARAPTVVAEHG